MDEKTRGFIESMMDEGMSTVEDAFAEVGWVRQEIPISSLRDLVIGYAIGVLRSGGVLMATIKPKHISNKEYKEIEKKIDEIIRRRLPELIEKIERELHR